MKTAPTSLFGESSRDGLGRGLLALMEQDERVVVLSADLTESTRVSAVAERFPDRFFQIGVAEQNLAGLAAGLALAGRIPFLASYAAFSPANNWGVIRTSLAYSQLPVRIIGGHAGLATGADGATHQALEDIALMRVLPHMTVLAPADAEEAYSLTLQTREINEPVYLRTSKLAVEAAAKMTESKLGPESEIQLGRARLLRAGRDLLILAHGTMVARALAAAARLAQAHHLEASVYSCHTLKPLDTLQFLELSQRHTRIMTLEDHQLIGGLGSALAEFLADHHRPNRLLRLGVNDQFGQSGSAEELYEFYGLSVTQIVARALTI